MRTILFVMAAFIAVCAGASYWTATGQAATSPGCTVDASIDSEEQAFLQIINQYRQQNGRQPLKLSTTLNKAAAWKSADMANNNYVAHDDTPSGRTWIQRIRDCGYTYNAWIGENIAVGNGSASLTFEQWRGSPGHNSNMLGSNYTAIGIGRAYNSSSIHGWYWTTEFGSYSDGYSAAAPTPTATPLPATATPQPTSQPPASLPCADLTGDGIVTVEDIAYVVARYQTTDARADLDRSGLVAVPDILIVVAQYFNRC
jgi:uncharacterized protein YkwD